MAIRPLKGMIPLDNARNFAVKKFLEGYDDYLLFIDDDIVVDCKYLETHIQYHQKTNNEHIAVISNISYAPEVIKGRNFCSYLQSRYLGNSISFSSLSIRRSMLDVRRSF